MNKPRILIVIDRFYPIIGGAETQALNLANYLHRNNHDVIVLTRQLTKNLKRSEKVNGVPVYRVAGPGFKRISQYKMALSIPFNLFKMRKNYDIVHCSDIFSVIGLMSIISSKVLRKKIVGRFTTIGIDKVGFLSKLIKPKILKFLDVAICPSKTVAEEAKRIGLDKNKIALIRHSFDTNRFKPVSEKEKANLRKELNLPLDKTLVIFAGRLTAIKRPELLLKAWSLLKKSGHENYKSSLLLFIGSGKMQHPSLEDELKIFAKQANLDNVIFVGEVYNIEKYYQSADVLVVPSEKDLPANVLLEGMFCGLPPITSDIPPNREIIDPENNGLLFENLNENDLFEKLLKFLSDKALREKISRNASKINSIYSSNMINKKYSQLYHKLSNSN